MEKQRLFNILYERAAIVRRERNTLSEELFYDFIAAFFQAGQLCTLIYCSSKRAFRFQDMEHKKVGKDIRILSLNKILHRFWFNLKSSRPFNHFMRQKLSKQLKKIKVSLGVEK